MAAAGVARRAMASAAGRETACRNPVLLHWAGRACGSCCARSAREGANLAKPTDCGTRRIASRARPAPDLVHIKAPTKDQGLSRRCQARARVRHSRWVDVVKAEPALLRDCLPCLVSHHLIVAAGLLACRPVSNDIDCADCSFVGRPCAGVASSITFLIPANNNSDILSELLRIAAPLCACT